MNFLSRVTCSIYSAMLIAAPNLSHGGGVEFRYVIRSASFSEAFDRSTGLYRDEYLDGQAEVEANACSGLLKFERKPPGYPNNAPPGRWLLAPPAGVHSYRWTVDAGTATTRVIDLPVQQNVEVYTNDRRSLLLLEDAANSCRVRILLKAGLTHSLKLELIGTNNVVVADAGRLVPIRPATLVVSIGDSYASGQGNPDVEGEPTDLGREKVCDWPTLSARDRLRPEMKREPIWRLSAPDWRSLRSSHAASAYLLSNTHAPVTFVSFAKSGARLEDVMEQVVRMRMMIKGRTVAALLISAGGNDLAFSEGLTALTGGKFGADEFRGVFDYLINHPKIVDRRTNPALPIPDRIANAMRRVYPVLFEYLSKTFLSEAELDSFDGKLGDLVKRVKDWKPQRIVWIGYPLSFFDDVNGHPSSTCEIFATGRAIGLGDIVGVGVEVDEALAIKEAANALNERLLKRIREASIRYIDLRTIYSGHGYCAAKGSMRYFVHARESCMTQGDFEGTMHPNADGVAATAARIHKELASWIPVPKAPPPVIRPTRDGGQGGTNR